MNSIGTAAATTAINRAGGAARIPGQRQLGSGEQPFADLLGHGSLSRQIGGVSETMTGRLQPRTIAGAGDRSDLEPSKLDEHYQVDSMSMPVSLLETSPNAATHSVGQSTTAPSIQRCELPSCARSGHAASVATVTAPTAQATSQALSEFVVAHPEAKPMQDGSQLRHTQLAEFTPNSAPAAAETDRLMEAFGYQRGGFAPSGTAVTSRRSETHLLAANDSGFAAKAILMADQIEPHEAALEGDLGLDVPEIAVETSTKGPALNDIETVPGQIASQVSGALASWRGGSSADGLAQRTTLQVAPGPLNFPTHDAVKTLRFELHPGELGEVHVRLSMNRNELRVQLSFAAERAAGIAKSEGQALMDAFAEAGLAVRQLVIDTPSLAKSDPQAWHDATGPQNLLCAGGGSHGGGARPERQPANDPDRRHPAHEGSWLETEIQKEGRSGIFI